MQKRCVAVILIFLVSAFGKGFSQGVASCRIIKFTSAHTAFPDSARAAGHLYDSILYTTAQHYNDSSVMLVVPPGFVAHKKVDLVFWFHGWHNNIDTAVVFYELIKQFVASHCNAVPVLAETAKNAPDSYGGKLEKQGVFKALVADVLGQLKTNKLVDGKAKQGNIVLAGHSGAYRVIANILQNGQEPVKEVLLFDALYSELDKYQAWLQKGKHNHFVHWFTNKGGGTDEMSDTMMKQLAGKGMAYTLIEETVVTPAHLTGQKVLFVHSLREHNVIINNPDNLALLLANSWCLSFIPQSDVLVR